MGQRCCKSKADPQNMDMISVTSESSDEEELDVASMKKKGKKQNRNAISAEAYGKWNKKEDFRPRVIPKSVQQKEKIRSKLMSSFLFRALDKQAVEIVINAMDIVYPRPGEYVIAEGDEGDNLYVVEEGTLDCTKLFAGNAEPTYLKTYQPGEAFGELALLYNAPRAANIIAKSACTLFALDRGCFSNIVKDAAMKKRERYEIFLKKVSLFQTMEDYERGQLADVLNTREYKPGDYIITEGEQGDSFYLLESGSAYATKILNKGSDAIFTCLGQGAERVMQYNSGDYFGELAMLKNAPRAASVIAETECICVFLDKQTFKRLLGPMEDMLKRNAAVYKQFANKQQGSSSQIFGCC